MEGWEALLAVEKLWCLCSEPYHLLGGSESVRGQRTCSSPREQAPSDARKTSRYISLSVPDSDPSSEDRNGCIMPLESY